jgi:hypothetical protein
MMPLTMPTPAAVQQVSQAHLSDRPEVCRFLSAAFAVFPHEVPAAEFSAQAISAARRVLLGHGMTVRGREQNGAIFLRLAETDRRCPMKPPRKKNKAK